MKISRRRIQLGTALMGVALLVGAALTDDYWQSVLIEGGATLGLVAVIAAIEERLENRVRAVEETASQTAVVVEGLVAAAQREQAANRQDGDDRLIRDFIEQPSPSSLWRIRERVERLGSSIPAQTTVGENAVVLVNPTSELEIVVTVTRRQSVAGAGAGRGRERFTWRSEDSLVDVLQQIDTAMASIGVHPGDYDAEQLFVDLGHVYGQRIAARHGN